MLYNSITSCFYLSSSYVANELASYRELQTVRYIASRSVSTADSIETTLL